MRSPLLGDSDPSSTSTSSARANSSSSSRAAEQRLRNRSQGSSTGSFSLPLALAEGLAGANMEGGMAPGPSTEALEKGGRNDKGSNGKGKGGGFTYAEIPWGEIFSNPGRCEMRPVLCPVLCHVLC